MTLPELLAQYPMVARVSASGTVTHRSRDGTTETLIRSDLAFTRYCVFRVPDGVIMYDLHGLHAPVTLASIEAVVAMLVNEEVRVHRKRP